MKEIYPITNQILAWGYQNSQCSSIIGESYVLFILCKVE